MPTPDSTHRPKPASPATFLPPRHLAFIPAGGCPDCGAYRSDGLFPVLHVDGCAFAELGFTLSLERAAKGEPR